MKLKFCGFRTLEDIAKVRDLDIDAIGFIHYPKSKRFVDVPTIKQFTDKIPKHIEKVVVVVNPNFDTISNLIESTSLTAIQLHGSESIELIQQIKRYFPHIKLIKALPASDKDLLLEEIEYYRTDIDQFIIDTPSESYGGTGKVYNWEILQHLKGIDYLIAGGINLENINKIEQLGLTHSGYDIASGIESEEIKDINKMKDIILKVKEQKI